MEVQHSQPPTVDTRGGSPPTATPEPHHRVGPRPRVRRSDAAAAVVLSSLPHVYPQVQVAKRSFNIKLMFRKVLSNSPKNLL